MCNNIHPVIYAMDYTAHAQKYFLRNYDIDTDDVVSCDHCHTYDTLQAIRENSVSLGLMNEMNCEIVYKLL